MSRSLRVTIDPAQASPSKTIRAAARGGALLILTGRLFADLALESGLARANQHVTGFGFQLSGLGSAMTSAFGTAAIAGIAGGNAGALAEPLVGTTVSGSGNS